MKKKLMVIDVLEIFIISILIIITVVGIGSFNIDKSYIIANQYGNGVEIFGSGIYAHDSYFKAPIFIGSDFTMLFLVVPMAIITLINEIKERTIKSKLALISVVGTILYYSTSIVFGVTYNAFHLAYIALFSSTFFAFIILLKSIRVDELRRMQKWVLPSRGLSIFLILTGIALFVAWLPDILTSLVNKESLTLIEVYTTEITYVLDMGIISPTIFICLYLLKKKDGMGDVLLAIILNLCSVIGIMLPVQSVFQKLAGIEIPIQALITKLGIFVVLASVALYFNIRFYKNIK